ncbi:hypothetical protein IMG5_131920 [Ichthyophthirius multifiliis]|uniref:VPS10 domain-containing protein n=1 Tax=Ichthyophthirius multifiliis TaxID=5932 RepID=G0QWG5_ICHMU|nr:hypothetical protein IMG5_131920 [Ichthyophthirius multifiliis]EGR30448.1 hypothetical protein IMG5_131920 [Ichthyophthirius multifiliis]|eukprot:XP_004032035.1 hypothetical protein IMG5_131920 [Ichthyophthirius multifiliis]
MKKYLIYLLIQTFYISQQAHNDIQINISSLDSPLQEIHWCGDDSSNDQGVVLLTTKGSVYTSDNRGISWQKKVEQFIKEGINAQQNLNEDIGYVHKIMSSPINSNEIVFIGTQGINWITTDCGQTIKPLGANMNLKEFAFHPTERTWMLASSWSVCDNKNENQSKNNQKNQCFVTKDLYLSQNFGQKWKLLTKYIVQFQWAQRFQNIQSKIPIQRIIYSKEIGNQGHQKIQGWNMKTHLFYSDDFLVKEQNMIVNQGNKFLITENYIFAAQVHNSQTQEVKLMVAQQNLQNEQNYKFNYVEIDQNIFQHSFTVLDTSEGQVFLNLNPYGYNSPLGIIYQSDSTGRRFSLSLQDNVRSTDGQCDFEKLFSVDGIYIANIYQGKKIEELKKSLLQKNPDSSNFDIPLESSINKKSQQQKISDINTQDLQKYIQTRITFNKGGNWSRINLLRKILKDKTLNVIQIRDALYIYIRFLQKWNLVLFILAKIVLVQQSELEIQVHIYNIKPIKQTLIYLEMEDFLGLKSKKDLIYMKQPIMELQYQQHPINILQIQSIIPGMKALHGLNQKLVLNKQTYKIQQLNPEILQINSSYTENQKTNNQRKTKGWQFQQIQPNYTLEYVKVSILLPKMTKNPIMNIGYLIIPEKGAYWEKK